LELGIAFNVSCISDPGLGDYVGKQHSLDIITCYLLFQVLRQPTV